MGLASDTDRERAAASLREHFASGRLSLEEFTTRIGLTLGARTNDELRPALSGLPAPATIPGMIGRGVALVACTGAWLVFSFVLLLLFGLTLVVHGLSGTGFAGFLVVWLVPTFLLSRLWRRGLSPRRGS